MAQHAGGPMGNTYQEHYSKVMEHTTKLTGGSEQSLNLWTGTLSDVSCFYLQKHAEDILAARFMNSIKERNRLLFDVLQI